MIGKRIYSLTNFSELFCLLILGIDYLKRMESYDGFFQKVNRKWWAAFAKISMGVVWIIWSIISGLIIS